MKSDAQTLHELVEKVEISIQQKSSHDSDMQKAINELSSRFTDLKKEVQPMLDAFNTSKETRIVFDRLGNASFRNAKWVTVVGGALFIIWQLIKFVTKYAQ